MEDSTPIIVGVGRVTRKPSPDKLPLIDQSPLYLIKQAVEVAVDDTQSTSPNVIADLDVLVVVKMFLDVRALVHRSKELYKNLPQAVADVLDIHPKEQYTTTHGGNMPQSILNTYAAKIAAGELNSILLTGGEALYSFDKAVKTKQYLLPGQKQKPGQPPKQPFPWGVQDLSKPFNGTRPAVLGTQGVVESTIAEFKHGAVPPRRMYPLLEQSLRVHRNQTYQENANESGDLFAHFSEVAALPENAPHSWFSTARSSEEISTPTASNRMVSMPYTKYMNSVDQVDQSAAVIMMSVARAKELGIPRDRWVFLHGCADTTEVWYTTERAKLYRSPAIKMGAEKAFQMAGLTHQDMDLVDIYSCFPVAVKVAAREIGYGFSREDLKRRPLTVTGGLPYHGGPGNNYVTHSIAAMCEKLRSRPSKYGLVTANGAYLTKHAFGVYSTKPFLGTWKRQDPAEYQAQLDSAADTVQVADAPDGVGKVEEYTICKEAKGLPRVIVVGLVQTGPESGKRFLANTNPKDENVLNWFTDSDRVGTLGSITTPKPGKYVFTPHMGESKL